MRLLSIAILSCLLFLRPARIAAQAMPERGGYIVTLGADTLSAEQFVRSGTSLEITRVARSPRVMVLEARAALG